MIQAFLVILKMFNFWLKARRRASRKDLKSKLKKNLMILKNRYVN